MSVRIFHTADLHIGMKLANYPEQVRSQLQQARNDVLPKMVQMANEKNCNLFVIAGDLFHNIKGIDKKTIAQAAKALDGFQGECVLVMSGNHDYDNDMIDLWKTFTQNAGEKVIYLNREAPYSLKDYGLNITVYPAPCHAKHSETNNIGWIKDQDMDLQQINIGIAHGSLEGISPDLDLSYYYMKAEELGKLPLDVWLLGHTHVIYPVSETVRDSNIFNPGTPEPDGLDCRHTGYAWLITIDDEKKASGERVNTGTCRFVDEEFVITGDEDLEKLKSYLLNNDPNNTVARVSLSGRVTEDTYHSRQVVLREIEQQLAYLIIEDSGLGIRITPEFTSGSFPQQFLSALADDEEALQMAYELIEGVRK